MGFGLSPVRGFYCQAQRLANVFTEYLQSSPVKSLVGALVKGSGWGQDMFGLDGSGNTFLMPQFLKVLKAEYPKRSRISSQQRGHPQALGAATIFEVEIQSSRFPPESATILLNEQPISTLEALETLADAVEDQWYESNSKYTEAWKNIRSERTRRNKQTTKRTGNRHPPGTTASKAGSSTQPASENRLPILTEDACAPGTQPPTAEVGPTPAPSSALQPLLAPPVHASEAETSAAPVPLVQAPFSTRVSSRNSPQTVASVSAADSARLSEDVVFPFSIVTSSTACFLKLKKDAYAAINPTYRTIRYAELPYLSPFQTVKNVLEGERCAVIRGTRRSGRTTMAQQLAIHFVRNSGSAYYLDLAATPPSSLFPQSVIDTLQFLCSQSCLLIIDNIEANRIAGTQIYTAWASNSDKALLLLIDTWAPVSVEPINIALPIPDERLIDLRFNFADYISVYKFWKATFANRNGAMVPELIKPHLSGASLGRFCDAMDAHRKAEAFKQDALSILESGAFAADLTKGFKSVRQIPVIRNFLLAHPEEKLCLTSMERLLCYLEEGRLSDHTQVTNAFSHLSEHPAHKWHYMLDIFSFVVRVLRRARTVHPPIYNSYCEVIGQERSFSIQMASRVLARQDSGASCYIAFAEEFLPAEHRVHMAECLFNAGPEFMWHIKGPWTMELVVRVLSFINKYLPRQFARSFVDRWSEPKARQKLQLLVAQLAAADGETFTKLAQNPLMLLLMKPKMLQAIAARPQEFIYQLLPARAEAQKVLCNDNKTAVQLSPDANEVTTREVVQTELATDRVFPFSIISPPLFVFRKGKHDPRLSPKPSYSEIYDRQLPRTPVFYRALSVTESCKRSVIIRGPMGSGKTTIAMQVALHLAQKAYTPLYLDLDKFNGPELHMNAIRTLGHLPTTASVFVIDNAHSNPIAAETIYEAWSQLPGESRMILTNRWAPAEFQKAKFHNDKLPSSVVDIHYEIRDFEKMYYFWKDRIVRHRKAPQNFRANTYFFLAACLRRLMEALSKRRDDIFTTGRVRAYQGQGELTVFDTVFPHHYKHGVPFLKEHLMRYPADEVYSRWTIGELIVEMADEEWGYRKDFVNAFANVLHHPIVKWKLLLDSFCDVVQFLRSSREAYPAIFHGYCTSVQNDSEFSEQMAMRVFSPEDFRSFQYVIWADAHLPREHVADIAEGFYCMGPNWVASNVAKAPNCAELGALLKFVKEWLPPTFWDYVADKWCQGPNVNELSRMIRLDNRLSGDVCSSMQPRAILELLQGATQVTF